MDIRGFRRIVIINMLDHCRADVVCRVGDPGGVYLQAAIERIKRRVALRKTTGITAKWIMREIEKVEDAIGLDVPQIVLCRKILRYIQLAAKRIGHNMSRDR